MDTKLQNLKAFFQKAVDPNNILSILTPHKIKTANLLVKTILLFSHTGSGFLLQASNKYIYESRKGMLRCLKFLNTIEVIEAIEKNGRTEISLSLLTTGQYFCSMESANIRSAPANCCRLFQK
ncbi:MAG: hypothetical protein ACYSSP_10080 [Planctomycetota bacterium]